MDMYTNEFSNDEITVTYEPSVCIHAEKCAKQLSNVFRTSIIPWINLDNAETNSIINQIKKCPSGALKYHKNENKKAS
ncbi:(4Fe-4S)-binding protein [Yeosuana marina]|uniref:(4Fe-4S)-binding protein n=1 Tax=Yeosuana marina TaxID=1565536 RepID=UPI001F0FE6EA|nr:(4Fe-4S)-binding protein [Yeosuana marina]|tara:strand:+ start:2708 stop:2941 length:234 start_codon:yes stop_codon:yes gene_type:complete